ncbi:hypothetical protein WJX79_006780 [Trebouxia sp. C0005]
MASSGYAAAEIEAVSVEDSFHEILLPATYDAGVVDLQADESAAQSQPSTSGKWTGLWRALTTAWGVADEHLANLFGLNQSKYEWAVQEYHWQKRQEDERVKQAVQSTKSQVQLTGADTDASENASAQSEALQGSSMV